MTTTRRIERRLLAILFGAVSAGLGVVSPASAQAPPDPGAEVDLDAVFQRGLDRFDARDYAGAIAIWERLLGSLGEPRGWKILYNLGLAYQAAGDATLAIERFEAFVSRVGDGQAPELAERRDDAAARARTIRASHGAVRVLAPQPSSEVLVRVGSAAPRPAGFTVYLAPGPHEIEIGIGTPRARRLTIEVTAGGSRTIETTEPAAPIAPVVPEASGAARPDETERPSGQGRAFPTGWFLAGVGLTAASVALPIALGVRAQSMREDAEMLGPGHTGYAAAADEFEAARTEHYVSYALPAALAAVTLAIPVVHFVLAASDTPGAGAPTKAGIPGSTWTISVRAAADQEGGGLWARGQF